jgi:Protein of unknown function (DUF3800)
MLCFVDESGDLSNYTTSGSSYFFCTAVLMWDYEPINVLQDLRLQLEHEGFPLPSGLHAKNDARPMKTRVFNLLSRQTIYIHSIALRKAKVYETLRDDEAFVYRIACRILFQSLFTRFLADQDDHSIVFSNYSGGSVAQKLKDFQRKLIEEFGTVHRSKRIAFWDASTHAGLQIADYYSWMLQRHLEMPTEEQSVQFHQLMKARIANLYLPFG